MILGFAGRTYNIVRAAHFNLCSYFTHQIVHVITEDNEWCKCAGSVIILSNSLLSFKHVIELYLRFKICGFSLAFYVKKEATLVLSFLRESR